MTFFSFPVPHLGILYPSVTVHVCTLKIDLIDDIRLTFLLLGVSEFVNSRLESSLCFYSANVVDYPKYL